MVLQKYWTLDYCIGDELKLFNPTKETVKYHLVVIETEKDKAEQV